MEIQGFIWKNSHELNKLHNNFPHYKFSIKYILQFFKEKHGKNKQTKSFPSAEKCLDLVSRWWRTPQLLPQLDLFSQKTKKNPSDNNKKKKPQSSRTSSVTPQRGQAPWRDFQAPPTCKVAISAEKRLWESKTPNSEGSRVIPVITSAWGAQGDAHPLISVKLPSLIWIINRFFSSSNGPAEMWGVGGRVGTKCLRIAP